MQENFGIDQIFHGIDIGLKKVEQTAFKQWLQERRVCDDFN